ncbi:hypothetical protein FHX75_13205 [Micromonospora palomenae]|uniref:Uncharacterized protein n=1 Tax=Micromonospora palomenae TaxID=1461247 RepID=A0A561VNI1_9ACTN|nr:hypothetical protein FHX75_13205 [Micromonospora palomenae]
MAREDRPGRCGGRRCGRPGRGGPGADGPAGVGRVRTDRPGVGRVVRRGRPAGRRTGHARQGRVARCGLTVRAKLLPLLTSQFTDQVIAPRMPG